MPKPDAVDDVSVSCLEATGSPGRLPRVSDCVVVGAPGGNVRNPTVKPLPALVNEVVDRGPRPRIVVVVFSYQRHELVGPLPFSSTLAPNSWSWPGWGGPDPVP